MIAEIGIVNGNKPGNYLIQRTDDAFVQPGFSNATANTTSNYTGTVTLPTTYGTMLIRLLLLSNTTSDLNIVHTYQNASNLNPVNRTTPSWVTGQVPSLNSASLNGSFLGINTPTKQFAFAAKLLQYNQPENYTDRYRVATLLTRAGLYNGEYHPQPGVNLTQAAAIANSSITADVTSPSHVRNEGNGWLLFAPSYQGNYGTNYAAAAYIALFGYQAQNVRQTLYPGFNALGFNSMFTLAPNSALLVTFSGKPVLQTAGFWSLTVYGSDQYLVSNPIDRYEVGDRTYNLTYETGGYIYGPSANATANGPFQILVQPASITPPSNWTTNWLPRSAAFSWICEFSATLYGADAIF